MFAIIEACGKQYKVSEGDVICLEKLGTDEGTSYVFDRVLVVSDDNGVKVGAPVIEGATVEATVEKNGKAKKIYIIRYKSKKNEKKKQGHRQPYTQVKITKINA